MESSIHHSHESSAERHRDLGGTMTFEEVNEQGGSAQQAASSADDGGTEDRDKRILQTQHVVNLEERWTLSS
ncbi:hypothetical protein KC365_g19218 [Hortaea werneckii]|nr:hypothetical protein KC339_g18651 [Hortaea werneckii]KAI7198306.1 hypothetical protein KC365_g19218 [Hortaea werneckii]